MQTCMSATCRQRCGSRRPGPARSCCGGVRLGSAACLWLPRGDVLFLTIYTVRGCTCAAAQRVRLQAWQASVLCVSLSGMELRARCLLQVIGKPSAWQLRGSSGRPQLAAYVCSGAERALPRARWTTRSSSASSRASGRWRASRRASRAATALCSSASTPPRWPRSSR